jgi:hypothetical protein
MSTVVPTEDFTGQTPHLRSLRLKGYIWQNESVPLPFREPLFNLTPAIRGRLTTPA